MQRHERIRRTEAEPPAEAPQPPAPRAEAILGLQRSVGNHTAIQVLLKPLSNGDLGKLVRDMEIVEKIEIDVRWEFTSKTAPPRTFNVTQRGPVAGLDPGQKERLTAQFPKFAYLP